LACGEQSDIVGKMGEIFEWADSYRNMPLRHHLIMVSSKQTAV
jgi:hypothetical protein